jgi:hypothetical protein
MNDQIGPSSLLDTTDSLEAVSVFRGWKNLMFLIVFLCLLLTQGGFWLVNTGLVDTDRALCAKAEACPAAAVEAAAVVPVEVQDPNKATADPNKPALAAPTETTAEAKAAPKSVLNDILQKVTIRRLCLGLSIVNAILILSACVYVLTILFSLKVSIVGKLGGISHIGRAFFLALFMFVLLLPWQRVFGSVVIGAIYTPCELVKAYSADRANLFANIIYYLRFSGYWLLIFFMLILTQMRTCRWTRAILRRLDVV